MDRKKFLKNSLGLLGASLILPKVISSCSSDDDVITNENSNGSSGGST